MAPRPLTGSPPSYGGPLPTPQQSKNFEVAESDIWDSGLVPIHVDLEAP